MYLATTLKAHISNANMNSPKFVFQIVRHCVWTERIENYSSMRQLIKLNRFEMIVSRKYTLSISFINYAPGNGAVK